MDDTGGPGVGLLHLPLLLSFSSRKITRAVHIPVLRSMIDCVETYHFTLPGLLCLSLPMISIYLPWRAFCETFVIPGIYSVRVLPKATTNSTWQKIY